MSGHREILRVFKSSQPIAYPFVIKAADTFGGQMNYVISSHDELKQRLAEHPKKFLSYRNSYQMIATTEFL